jgi:3-oxochol-4-en-24-oyl-CoA dehydrogenase
MSIAISEEHRELERVARQFLRDVGAREWGRELLDADEETLPPWWEQIGELGWLGLHVAEEHGGSGYGLPELAVLLEESGRACAAGPLLPTLCASAVIQRCGNAEQQAAWLPSLASGERTAAVGFGGTVDIQAGKAGGDGGLVLGGMLADLVILPSGDDLVVIAGGCLERRAQSDLDPTRRHARITLVDAPVGELEILVGARRLGTALTRILAAAEAAGGAHASVEMAVDYANEREQFGRVIGSFQAVKHHCADMKVSAEMATAAVWDAARSQHDHPAVVELAAGVAAVQAFPGFLQNAQINIQIHGGIGFTWEHDAHLFLRRAGSLHATMAPGQAAATVTELLSAGVHRRFTLDLPAEAERIRSAIRQDADEIRTLPETDRTAALIASGYVQPHWPKPWGRDAGPVEQLIIEEEFAAIPRPNYGIGTWIILTLIQHGSEEQVERWVGPSLEGQLVWCQLFSEPAAGSDAAGIRTKASRVEGGWLLNGQKVWTTGAQFCNRGFATVRTDPTVPKHEGITTVVIDLSADGVDIRPLREITGHSLFNEVFFDDVFVPDDDVVGAVNGGWKVARSTLGNERVSIGSGMFDTTGGLDLLELVRSAGQDLSGVDRAAGRLLAEGHAMRLLNVRSAQRAVSGTERGAEGNVAKLLSAEHVQRLADLALALAGPEATTMSAESPVGTLLLSSRGLSIAGGTSEITRNQIAERLLGLPRDPLLR